MHSKQEAVFGESRPAREVKKMPFVIWDYKYFMLTFLHFVCFSVGTKKKKHNSSRHAQALNRGSARVPAKHYLTNEDLVRLDLETDK